MKRTNNTQDTPSGLTAIRPLPELGNAHCSYLTQGGGRTNSTKTDLSKVTPSRRRASDPALSEPALTSLSNLNRLVRTRRLGGVGAGEGDLPGYPIRRAARSSSHFLKEV